MRESLERLLVNVLVAVAIFLSMKAVFVEGDYKFGVLLTCQVLVLATLYQRPTPRCVTWSNRGADIWLVQVDASVQAVEKFGGEKYEMEMLRSWWYRHGGSIP
jgi:hypothetical protein